MQGFTRTRPVIVVVLALLAVGCGSTAVTSTPSVTGSSDRASGSPAATSTSQRPVVPAKASKDNPLAERKFQVEASGTTAAQRDAIAALEGYLDGLVVAFATNKVPDRLRRYTTPSLYQDARELIREQVNGRYVIYGAFVFAIQPRGGTANVAVINVCVDQHDTRRHDVRTDKAGRRNNTPYVRLDYTLNRLPPVGWVVVGYKTKQVPSCRG